MQKKNNSSLPIIIFLVFFFIIASNLFNKTNNTQKITKNVNDGVFDLLVSSENKDLEDVIKKYFKNKKIKLNIEYAGTIDIMEKINSGEAYDAIWASNSIWLYMLDNTSAVKNAKSTSINPIVFGIKKSLAEKLGLVNKDVYTKDILNKIKNGDLNFVMSSATRTNTGASAYLGFVTTLAGNPEVLTNKDLQSETLRDDIVNFLSGVERTSGSDEFLDNLLLNNKYDAALAYESSFINLNKKLEKEGKETFYLIYPIDGVTISDSPLAYINNGNKYENEFNEFQSYILSDEGQNELAKYGRRVWYGGINPNADQSVFNKNWGIDTSKYIVPIKYPSVAVIKNALNLYQSEFRKPTHTIFCLDYSGSMDGNGNKQLVDAMKYILNEETASKNMLQFSYKDKITIIPFASSVMPEISTQDGTNVERLIKEIENTNVGGTTNIYGSLIKAVSILSKEDSEKYNLSIILMTDGLGNVDTFSNFKANYDLAKNDIPIYGILFGSASDSQLKEISSYTGGKVFDGRNNLLAAFKEVRGYN